MLVQVGIYIGGGHISAVKGNVATLVSVINIHVYSPTLVIIQIMCEDINL